jgi:L-lactate dehydrogenase
MTVGVPTPDVVGVRNVTVSLPRLICGQGVLETFPQPLNQEETARLHASAAISRQALDELGEP